MSNYFKKILDLILILFFTSGYAYSQRNPSFQAYRFSDHWQLSVKTGGSLLLFEFQDDYKVLEDEMNNKPGISTEFSLTKLISRHWEVGYGLEISQFRGHNNNPNFSALQYHEYISKMSIEPVDYNTFVNNHSFLLNYHFKNFGTLEKGTNPINLFVGIRIGFSHINSILKYSNDIEGRESVIYAKRQEKNIDLPNSAIHIGALHGGIRFGARYCINERFQIKLINEFIFVNDDLLDGVHNYIYIEELQNSISYYTNDFYTKFQLGITYNVNLTFKSNKRNFYQSKYRSSKYNPKPAKKRHGKKDLWYSKK